MNNNETTPKKRGRPAKKFNKQNKAFSLTETARNMLVWLSDTNGIGQTAMVEILIRDRYNLEQERRMRQEVYEKQKRERDG